MAFQTPITIEKALERIARHDYLLPAIQREVVWRTDQIVRLFDSLMQGYPIGSFLFWKVERKHSQEFTFYEFITHYHQRTNRHLKSHDLFQRRDLTGILDGQQRLTAVNIGLRGSHAEKLPRLWVDSPWAYPVRHLYLDLGGYASGNDLGMIYDFRFLSGEQVSDREAKGEHWFKVSDIRGLADAAAVFMYLQGRGLTSGEFPFPSLSRLHDVVHKDPVISYFEEESQDLDKVLNIFIRVNSGGTVLSYSDLLLSIATAQWRDLDAREVIHGLVDDLNETGQRFDLNKDLVLKAGLVLTDIPSIAFRVTNFNTKNMATLETHWNGIAHALKLAVQLLSDFGFSARTLTADSVIIPVAYYLYKANAHESFLTAQSVRADRERIRGWVVRSLLKPGVWGSGLDQLLLALRDTIQKHGTECFPVSELEAAMAQRGKSLRFGEDEIQDLLGLSYSDKRTFPLLSLLYPGMDLKNEFHVDHIFPRSRFTRTKLLSAGVAEAEVEELIADRDRLPNLQLMEGPVNVSKQDKLPAAWMQHQYPDVGALEAYRARHELGDVPDEMSEFTRFYDDRRSRIASRIRSVLGVPEG
jgi:hypothetical protein